MKIERDLLAKNDALAKDNRHVLEHQGVRALNLIGSPGAGKTALLEATIATLRPHVRMAVLEGDQATDRDAQRIARAGCHAIQMNTGTGCHLDASMMARGLQRLELERGTLVFVENVGNLVCPALFDLGEHAKVVVLSVTEGEDKPLKYPHVFRAARALVLTKIDLLAHLDFDVAECIAHARSINPELEVFHVSAKSGVGIDAWSTWARGS